MNSNRDYTIKSYEYTPIYVIESKNAAFVEQKIYNVINVPEPIITKEQSTKESLKAFYENSVNLVGELTQSPTLQKESEKFINVPHETNVNEYIMINELPQQKPVSTVQIKTQNTFLGQEINSVVRKTQPSPKKKKKIANIEKESSNHTSVHLIKMGSKYHSLNHLTDEQTRLVTQALSNIGDLEKMPLKPTYDAATNTRIVYKVVSPNDLKVIGKSNNNIVTEKKSINNDEKKCGQKAKSNTTKRTIIKETEIDNVLKVTRSGRTVKVPKYIKNQESEEVVCRNKKKVVTTMACLQCSVEFNSIYKLQRHYDMYPSHIPTNTHTNLFHCLLAIVNNSNSEDKSSIFLQQLEQLINKLKSILPCLLKKFEGVEGTFCRISEDIGRLFGMTPGKYNLNMDALNCIKETDGSCKHNPPKSVISDLSKPSQVWLSKHKKDIAVENEEMLCARTNSIEKWPPFTKRAWKYRQSLMSQNAEMIDKRQLTETGDIDLSNDNLNKTDNYVKNTEQNLIIQSNEQSDKQTIIPDNDFNQIKPNEHREQSVNLTNDSDQITGVHKKSPIHFHSAHFDIKSSPIKNQQSDIFKQFQINMSKLPSRFEGQLFKPSTFVDTLNEQTNSDHSLDGIFKEINNKRNMGNSQINIDLNCQNTSNVSKDVCFNHAKSWIGTSNIETHVNQSHENYIQANTCIEPKMIHLQDNIEPLSHNNQIADVLNVSDSCLPLPPEPLTVLERLGNYCLTFNDSEVRNNPIELSLDLFSFHNP